MRGWERGVCRKDRVGVRSGGLSPPNPPSMRPQPRIVQSPPLCPGWGFICMTTSRAWRGGLALGFLGHIPAAFPSKWAPSRCRGPCQSNSLLWNRETKISSVFFRRGQGRSGNPADPTVFPFNPPLPLFPLRMSGAAARARTSQTEAKPKNTHGEPDLLPSDHLIPAASRAWPLGSGFCPGCRALLVTACLLVGGVLLGMLVVAAASSCQPLGGQRAGRR